MNEEEIIEVHDGKAEPYRTSGGEAVQTRSSKPAADRISEFR